MDLINSFKELKIRGAQINYYFICKTKLYLFSKNIQMEKESDIVELGNIIHRSSYKNERKEVIINSIAIDFIRNSEGILEVHEVKKSDRMKKADIYQLLYYLYYLKKLGIEAIGILNYPSKHKVEKIILTKKDEKELMKIIEDIENIIHQDKPIKPERKSYCKKCAYYEFCFS
ncbi:CRISPR-associated protein Cas4 [Methanothermococcus okinawensis]|uniref:CRISPR-associated exonuclease Cas4 n=1 Tax=Methanothermococcus okinawensis (strain DSM 14208 / JCM 11175 / IH1) TaxID=647113 RepID=F8AMY8_METOI|nr:CRISPR-associated protein Cas4 [Methanothermococcus okinawensis]AEH06111.1 CRISPR-associated protein Cas4 [Methanothermococcus okinawensis IH1]